MSRLQTRIAELERMLGRCRDCKTIVELVEDSSSNRAPRVEYCRSCGQPLERITVRLSFDPDAGGPP